MGIKSSFTKSSLDNYFVQVLQIVKEETIRSLSYLGEQAITRVRDRSGGESWFDRTGNLRSSVGYAVTEYGKKQIESTFAQVLNGAEGSAKGREYVDQLAQKYSYTYALIVVAAMDYAERVESLDNKDVLASAELWAKHEMSKYMEYTKKRIQKRISKLEL